MAKFGSPPVFAFPHVVVVSRGGAKICRLKYVTGSSLCISGRLFYFPGVKTHSSLFLTKSSVVVFVSSPNDQVGQKEEDEDNLFHTADDEITLKTQEALLIA